MIRAARRRLRGRTWIPGTAIGMGLGLLLWASVVGYGTSLGDLAVMGALTGAVLGPAQALALPGGARARWAWAVVMPPLWAFGWPVTTLAGVDVATQWTVFGPTGALTVSALSGLLIVKLAPRPAASALVPVPEGPPP
ncbi:hypothetical protein PHK61_31370 [Actinomycetospora lutea]|uniref:hypothetical protein n=1 Tax=Actinomycetospora lutea TaxID=663604 RepID=UPI00236568EF|nr:hypothetical protein [Actinomycetospora lutea]MDD7942920.1 hypothetical protein [Actinomycetospora lutea]